ncbi:integrase core domain-containing protein, partial [Acinetobacter sp. YH16042]
NSPKNDFTLKVPTVEGIHLLYLEINKIFSLSCQPICNSAQLATLNWVDWFNKERVHSALGYVSPFDFEAMYYDKINPLGQVA